MKNMIRKAIAASVLLASSSTVFGAAILEAGYEMNSQTQAYMAAHGYQVNVVTASALASTTLTGYQGIWLSWETTYPTTPSFVSALQAYVYGGGNLFFEQADTNLLGFIPNGADLVQTHSNGDSVHIVANTKGLMDGLTDANLSNWGSSFHNSYRITGTNWTCNAVMGTSASDCLIASSSYGAGNIVVTGMDPSFHVKYGGGSTGADSSKLRLVLNGLTQSSEVDLPEPASLSLFGLGLLGFAARRRKQKAQ